ncbi:hypothetical protein M440DRAFT_216316 [Trichoderma longibrachiatum ATCC 18648]|uniref:Uncharacterized protein n=1 Tax=Trichoderma longibrachiatum ATCC 18648 TaxID=983965 RepID=A0A2T4BQF5_TRILO|nr:hypothetical protein M440DRAFT_216316 [Trichoderma longibrachiatum ATCC 18648]
MPDLQGLLALLLPITLVVGTALPKGWTRYLVSDLPMLVPGRCQTLSSPAADVPCPSRPSPSALVEGSLDPPPSRQRSGRIFAG